MAFVDRAIPTFTLFNLNLVARKMLEIRTRF